MKIQLLVFLALAPLAMPLSAQVDRKVFGVDIGKPLSVQECPITELSKNSYTYSVLSDSLCFTRNSLSTIFPKRGTTAPQNENIMLRFPALKPPAIMRGGMMGAIIVDGSVEYLAFNTSGVQDEDAVLDVLKQKYGEPTAITKSDIQNGFGARFPSVKAIWNLSDLTVEFHGTTTKIDIGEVLIGTAKGMERKRSLTPAPGPVM